MTAIETIRCDGCGLQESWRKVGQTNTTVLRKVLSKEGWHVVRKTGTPPRDLCERCWTAGKR